MSWACPASPGARQEGWRKFRSLGAHTPGSHAARLGPAQSPGGSHRAPACPGPAFPGSLEIFMAGPAGRQRKNRTAPRALQLMLPTQGMTWSEGRRNGEREGVIIWKEAWARRRELTGRGRAKLGRSTRQPLPAGPPWFWPERSPFGEPSPTSDPGQPLPSPVLSVAGRVPSHRTADEPIWKGPACRQRHTGPLVALG